MESFLKCGADVGDAADGLFDSQGWCVIDNDESTTYVSDVTDDLVVFNRSMEHQHDTVHVM